jgi:hypothetical protein
MTTVINAIPPLGTTYQMTNPGIQLFDKLTLQPLGTLDFVTHTPDVPVEWAPPPDVDCFLSTAQVQVQIFDVAGGQPLTVSLSGPTQIVRGPAHDIGGGMIRIDTEMVSMSLTGSNPLLGPVTVQEDVTKASTGRISGPTPGAMYPADSNFDVFFVMSQGGNMLRPVNPVHMALNPPGGLSVVPPPPGTQYQGTNSPIDLVDARGIVRGRLLIEIHNTGQPIPWITDSPEDRSESAFYGLRGTYPNPFAQRTSLSFRLDRERQVSLRIYDVRGQLVRTVKNGKMAAGMQVLEWDGKDRAGQVTGTGVYFYRIEIDGESLTRKVIKMQ